MSTATSTQQVFVKSLNVLDNGNVKQKIAAQAVIDFTKFTSDTLPLPVPIQTTAVEVDLSIQSSNQPAQNQAAFATLCLCVEFDYQFAVTGTPWAANYKAGDLTIQVSDTGFKAVIPGPFQVNPTGIDPTLTVVDQLFKRTVIIPLVATQNSIIKFTKQADGPVTDGTYGNDFSGLATIVLLNYEIPPVTIA